MTSRKWIGASLLLISAALWLNNSSAFIDTSEHQTKLLSHRGVHQIYRGEHRGRDTCSASSIAPLEHPYIANTVESLSAAFAYGSEVVELDVHLTRDNQFAVYHDWTLDCQTDGTGVTHEQSMSYLKTLDLGYGHTADNGASYPLRGTAVGAMPTLVEVFEANLGGQYLVNFKSNRKSEGLALAKLLEKAEYRQQVFAVYGGAPPTRQSKNLIEGLAGFDRQSLKSCLLSYLFLGWSGYVPSECQTGLIAIPANYAPWLWGWPHKFTSRMNNAGTSVILWGPYDGSGYSSGIDQTEELALVPAHFDGYVWSNKVESIGPLLKKAF